ncbi:hypothetical protein Salmuc_01388 [Salipiger mucosus DSM 16094]|uniref:Uncharacterized protein n=2 Tax=Salipiger mucosus TaxID=263378 RepID=S9S3P0_9RHOB|nr:hypothetical protein Salmuc_01388 [Salipiger mucosus DSM 16094]
MNSRIWSDRDLEFLESLASLCSHQVLFRATLQTIKIIA